MSNITVEFSRNHTKIHGDYYSVFVLKEGSNVILSYRDDCLRDEVAHLYISKKGFFVPVEGSESLFRWAPEVVYAEGDVTRFKNSADELREGFDLLPDGLDRICHRMLDSIENDSLSSQTLEEGHHLYQNNSIRNAPRARLLRR